MEIVCARPEPEPVSDWLKTSYPTAEDIDRLRADVRELEPARRKLREAEQTLGGDALFFNSLEHGAPMMIGLPVRNSGTGSLSIFWV